MRSIWPVLTLMLFSGALLGLPLAARGDAPVAGDPGATIAGAQTTTTPGGGGTAPQTTQSTIAIPPAGAGTAATPETASPTGPAEEAKEIIRLAVAQMSQTVATYNTKVRQVDAADAQYRKDFGQYAQAQQGIANLLAGHPGDRAYSDLIADRDGGSASARQDLNDLRDAAQAATESRSSLKSSPLWATAIHEGAPCGAVVDLTRFSTQLKWGNTVDPGLKYVQAVPADTSDSGSAANEQLAATLKAGALTELDAAVKKYNSLLQDAVYYKTASASASQTASQTATNPANPASSARASRGGRGGRGQGSSASSAGQAAAQAAAQTAAQTAAADKQQMDQDLAGAARLYRWLAGFPAIMGSTYQQANSGFPDLPFIERL